MKRWSHLFLCAFLSASLAPVARAGLVLDLTDGGFPAFVGSGRTLGWEFRVNSPITISGLGFFDADSDGLELDHLVRLWTSDATLIASATITSSSAPVASAHPAGRWLTESLAVPVALIPGTSYVVAADYAPGDPDFLRHTTGFVTVPEIHYTRELARSGSSGFPTDTFGLFDRYFGPTLLVEEAPEPSTLALFCIGCIGLLGTAGLHRDRGTRPRVRWRAPRPR
jgi:hypothetical protein